MCSQQNVLFKTVLNVRKDCITEDFFYPSSTTSIDFVGKLKRSLCFQVHLEQWDVISKTAVQGLLQNLRSPKGLVLARFLESEL